MTESGTDLRILTSRESNKNPLEPARGIKRRLEESQETQVENEELQRIERPSAPKRRRRSKEGVVGKVKKSISNVFQYVSTFLFGCSEEEEGIDIAIQTTRGERDLGQDQAVDMTQQGYNNRQYTNAMLKNKENSNSDPDDIVIIEGNPSASMTFKADIHHRYDSSDERSVQNKKRESHKFSSPFQNQNEFLRPSMGFGVQASGPLSTKSSMANIKFQGRQFAVSTQEKRDVERKKSTPSFILNQIRQKNISATTNDSSYRPLGVVDKIFREDIARGVRRTKAGGAIMHHKSPVIKRNAFFEASRQDEYMKYKAILENSPGTGLVRGAFRSRLGISKKSVIQSPWNDSGACNRTSLFESPITSSAVNRTRFNRQITAGHMQRISKQSASSIPVVNLEDEDENTGKKSKGFTTTIFTPKVLGPDADVIAVLDQYSPQSSVKNVVGIAPEKKSSSSEVKSHDLETELKQEKVYKDDYLQELLDKYVSRTTLINRSIRQETVKVDHQKERRLQAEKAIEARLKQHLTITDVAIPEPEDESAEDETEDVLLPEMTTDIETLVESALKSGAVTLIDAYKIPITGKDVNTLRGLNWLNDEVINFYMQMIVERSSSNESGWPKVYATNTFFYPKLMQSGHSALKRWTRKIDIFSYDLILIPVHLGMHWCLATVDLKQKAVFYYDSMGGDNATCLNALLKYLQDEHMDKKKAPFDTSDFQSVIVKDIPRQMNGSDCGMFACKFAEYLSRDAVITFTQEDMPYFRRRMIYEIVKNNLMYP